MVTARIFDEDTKTFVDKEETSVTSDKPIASRTDPAVNSETNGQDESNREVHASGEPTPKRSQLWAMTWERINLFLPNLKNELFGHTNLDTKNSIGHEPVHQPIRSQSTNFESTREQETSKTDNEDG